MGFRIPKDLELAVEAAAKRHKLPVHIVMGMVMQESSCRWEAERYEQGYRWVWDVKEGKPFRKLKDSELKDLPPAGFEGLEGVTDERQEWEGQRTSYGPLQVMGAVARELGFKGQFPDLNGVEGLLFGTLLLVRLRSRWLEEAGWEGVIEAYNRGSPAKEGMTDYARKVFNYAADYKAKAGV